MTVRRPKWPRLSQTLPPAESLLHCQSCGQDYDISRWREHDSKDAPQDIAVLLCEKCAKDMVDPHPRLYSEMDDNEPLPGAMAHLCELCTFRNGTRCTHPELKANGGTGLAITCAPPLRLCHDLGTDNPTASFAWPRQAAECKGFAREKATARVLPIQWKFRPTLKGAPTA